jgi:integrase
VRKQDMRREKIFLIKKEAIEWEAEQRRLPAEAWRKEIAIASLTLFDWATKYLDFSKTRYVLITYQEKVAVFKRFFKEVEPNKPVDELEPGQALAYLQKQAEERSGYGANRDRKNLVAGWYWGIKYIGLPTPNPFLVDKFPEQRKHRYVPPEPDFWEVYEVAEGQDKVMLLAYLHLAARRSEVFKLRWEDVDFGQARISLATRKRMGGNLEYDWLPMTDDLFNALLTHRQGAAGGWVFPHLETGQPFKWRRTWMRQLCKKAKVKPFGIHAIRHLTASILAQSNVAMVQIQAVLRHKSLATTERYIKRLGDLKPALEVLSNKKSRLEEPSTPPRRRTHLKVVN